MDPLVSTDWLSGELGKPDLVVFDATKYLPTEAKDGRAEFLAAHIPGARYFDIDEVADRDTDLPHMVPTPGRFAKLMGAMGVANASRVVFYDQKGLASAARGWWLMGLYGHDRAAVLDGGLPKWRGEGRRVEVGPPAVARPTVFRPDFRAARLRGIGDVLRNLEGRGELVLDARAAGRFTGAIPEPRAGMRSGHIPGSRSLPYTELLNARRYVPRSRSLAGALRASRRRRDTPGGDKLRQRRDRLHPDLGAAPRRPAGGRGL